MTTYDEICAAFRDALPRRLALSKAIEELPHRLRIALSTEIGAPNGSVACLTAMHQRSIPYVYLACPVGADEGLRKWEPCPDRLHRPSGSSDKVTASIPSLGGHARAARRVDVWREIAAIRL